MIVKSEKTLALFRLGPCEFCGRAGRTEAHHLSRRGHGGGGRLDVACNLAGLCWTCHKMETDGHISRDAILEIVARREGRSVESIEAEIAKLRRS